MALERDAAYGKDELTGLLRRLIDEEGFVETDFVLAGSARLLFAGILDHISDIDIVARGMTLVRAFELTRRPGHGGVVRGENTGDEIAQLFGGRINVSEKWVHSRDRTDELIDCAETVGGFRCFRWRDIRSYKKGLDREKDREDLAVLRRTFGTPQLLANLQNPQSGHRTGRRLVRT